MPRVPILCNRRPRQGHSGWRRWLEVPRVPLFCIIQPPRAGTTGWLFDQSARIPPFRLSHPGGGGSIGWLSNILATSGGQFEVAFVVSASEWNFLSHFYPLLSPSAKSHPGVPVRGGRRVVSSDLAIRRPLECRQPTQRGLVAWFASSEWWDGVACGVGER